MYSPSEKREKIKAFLLSCSHYDKSRLIQGAKNKGLFSFNEDDNEVYDSLKRFAKFHNIQIEKERITIDRKPEVAYVEDIDEDGNVRLKQLDSSKTLKSQHNFLTILENQRDILSNKLLKINSLIKLYKKYNKISL